MRTLGCTIESYTKLVNTLHLESNTFILYLISGYYYVGKLTMVSLIVTVYTSTKLTVGRGMYIYDNMYELF
jgi:hypothetical protein